MGKIPSLIGEAEYPKNSSEYSLLKDMKVGDKIDNFEDLRDIILIFEKFIHSRVQLNQYRIAPQGTTCRTLLHSDFNKIDDKYLTLYLKISNHEYAQEDAAELKSELESQRLILEGQLNNGNEEIWTSRDLLIILYNYVFAKKAFFEAIEFRKKLAENFNAIKGQMKHKFIFFKDSPRMCEYLSVDFIEYVFNGINNFDHQSVLDTQKLKNINEDTEFKDFLTTPYKFYYLDIADFLLGYISPTISQQCVPDEIIGANSSFIGFRGDYDCFNTSILINRFNINTTNEESSPLSPSEYIENIFKQNPEGRKKNLNKTSIIESATSKFPKVSNRELIRIWDNLVSKPQYKHWTKSGRTPCGKSETI